jgi:TM2 domain-containing membrane protein YozV
LAASPEKPQSTPPINLRDRRIAALLAWLVPGLGHFYQGRRFKAIVFFVCIFGTYSYGLALGEGRVVYAPTRDTGEQFRLNIGGLRLAVGWRQLQFVTQAAVGLPTMPAVAAAYIDPNGSLPLTGGNRWFMPPDTDELNEMYLLMPRRFELGTLFTLVAGLLNILAIFDAYGGPVILEPKKREEEDEEDKKEGDKKGKEAESEKGAKT